MEKIRKGNDIEVKWAIYAGNGINETPYSLADRNLKLYLTNRRGGRMSLYNYKIEGHVISFIFWGKEQEHYGKYTLTLVENEGRSGMHTVDECDAFSLVECTCEQGGEPERRVRCVHLQFKTRLSVEDYSEGTKIDIDGELSTTSENPVQNKAIAAEFSEVRAYMYEMIQGVKNMLKWVKK